MDINRDSPRESSKSPPPPDYSDMNLQPLGRSVGCFLLIIFRICANMSKSSKWKQFIRICPAFCLDFGVWDIIFQMSDSKENITKSIVYGNNYKNEYGTFLPICSAISQRAHVDKILDYLRSNKFFVKYTRYAYAYRVEEIPVVFITEKKSEEIKFLEGCHSDQTVEGSGDKLLHLLEKLNIRNVFVAVIIDQKDPLKRFECSNYRAIVENCRQLLNILYNKVVKAELKLAKKQPNLIIENEKTLVLKKCQIDQEVDLPDLSEKPAAIQQRPNHIYSEGKPTFLQRSSKVGRASSNMAQIKFLKERCKTFQEQFSKLMTSLEPKDFEHLKFMVTYDKNPLVGQVFTMLEVVEDCTREQLITEYDFHGILELQLGKLDDKRLRRLTDMFISNKLLIVDNIMKINKVLAVVFSLIDLMIRNCKAQQRIQSLREINETEKLYS